MQLIRLLITIFFILKVGTAKPAPLVTAMMKWEPSALMTETVL